MHKNNLYLVILSALLLFIFTSKSALAGEQLSDQQLQALGISPSELKTQLVTYYGVTSHYTHWIGLLKRNVVLTNESLYVIDEDGPSIEVALPLSKIKSVEIVRTSSLFGKMAKIEVDTDIAFLMFMFQPGKAATGETLYSALIKEGVRESVSTMVKDNSDEGKHKVRTLLPLKEKELSDGKI